MRNKSSYGIWTILFSLAGTYVFAKFQGGFVSWFIFYTIVPIFIIALGLYLCAFRQMTVRRVLTKNKYTAGQTVQVKVVISNPLRIPYIFIHVEDTIGSVTNNVQGTYKRLVFPGFRKEVEVHYDIKEISRGMYKWRRIKLRTGDLFGLVQKERVWTDIDDIVVYPLANEIRYWKTFNEKNTGATHTLHRQDEDVSMVMGIRDYAPGDRLARIHWKATAKSGTFKTKEYEHQVTNDFMFMIDRDVKSYEHISPETFERLVSLTATLIRFALRQRFSAGLVSYGQEAKVIPQAKDQEQLYRIYEHLARVQVDTTFPFTKTILKEVPYLTVGTTVVVITPRMSEKLALVLGELSYRKIKVECFWVGDQNMTNEEKQRLTQLDQAQVAYYIVQDDHFSRVLAGGERDVTA